MGFAQNLAHLMDKHNMSMYQLSKETGCHASTVSYWLNDGRVPQKRTMAKIAEVFNVTTEELKSDELPPIRKKWQKNSPPQMVGSGLSPAKLAFIEKLRLIDDEDVELLNGLLDSILARRVKGTL